jgi:surface antigen
MRQAVRGAVVVLTVALAACSTQGPQEQAGMVIGGVLGGVIGAQVGEGSGRTAATIIGAMAGMAVGGTVGRSMDEQDRRKTAHTLETVRSGVPSQWRNPDSGNQYRVTPTRTFQTAQGPCREYTVDGLIGGKRETLIGTACRQADGSWRVMN